MLHTSNFEQARPVSGLHASVGNSWTSASAIPRYESARSRLAMLGTLGSGILTLTGSAVRLEGDDSVRFQCNAQFGWCSTVFGNTEYGPALTISFLDKLDNPVADDLRLPQLNRSGIQPLMFNWTTDGKVTNVFEQAKRIRINCPQWRYWPIH